MGKKAANLPTGQSQYQVVGRFVPNDKYPEANAQIIAVNQIYEKSPTTVKNFGIWFRYESRTGTHNSYKEYRELSLTDAVAAMYQDMAGRSRAKACAIQILKTA